MNGLITKGLKRLGMRVLLGMCSDVQEQLQHFGKPVLYSDSIAQAQCGRSIVWLLPLAFRPVFCE